MFHQTDVPRLTPGTASGGACRSGGSVPFHHATGMDGAAAASGLGDAQLNTKIQLRAAGDTHTVGFALIPVVEILGEAGPDGVRMHWALARLQGATYPLAPSATVFGSIGKTISRADPTSATLAINAGVSLTFQAQPGDEVGPSFSSGAGASPT